MPKAFQVAGRSGEHATAADHRFDDDGRNRLRAFHADDPLKLIGAGERAGRRTGAEATTQPVGRRDMQKSGHQRLECLFTKGLASGGGGAHREAVIGAVTSDDLVPVFTGMRLTRALPRHLESGFDSL